MTLPTGYPNNPITYWLGIATYVLTLLVSVALLLLLWLQKNNIQNSTKKITNSAIRCLLFSLIRSLSWLISNIALIKMVYETSNFYSMNLLSVISGLIGYVFQYIYVAEVGFFLKENLIYICQDTVVQVQKCGVNIWRFLWVMYLLSALIFNIFFIVSDVFDNHQYDYIETVTSWAWLSVSFVYNLLILISFNSKLHNLTHQDYTKRMNKEIVEGFTKQATLMSFITMSMITYIIATHIWFHNNMSLIYWHVAYLFTQSMVLFATFLTFNLDSNSDFYSTFCKCCHSICRQVCIKCTCNKREFALLNEESDTDVQFLQMECVDVEVNSKVEKLCLLLQKYNKNENINENEYDAATILNDFNYVLEHHDSENDFNKIHVRLTENNQHHHYKQCKIYSRHNSRRTSREHQIEMKIDLEENINSESELTMILDKIHSFYYHSYDTFLRKKYFPSDESDDEKKQAFSVDDDMIDFKNNKFSSNLNANDNDNVYGFGERFEYEDTDEDKSNIIHVNKKYKNFEQELLHNTYNNCGISKRKYEQEFIKCKRNMQLVRTKNLQNRNIQDTLLTEYILALQIYCNCDDYQKAWTETFRRLTHQRPVSIPETFKKVSIEHDSSDDSDKGTKYSKQKPLNINSTPQDESIPSLIARHENFYWSSKYLMKLIECFGERLIDDKNQRLNKTFWRGVVKVLYPKSTIAQFNGPLSTSEAQAVAYRFSGAGGIMLALRYSYSTDPFTARYFDCKYYSDFSNEKECLFIGGKPMMIITNISQLKDDKWCVYKKYINAINIINSLLNGTHNGSDIISINDKSVDLCCDLLSSQLLKQSDNLMNLLEITGIPEYVLHLAYQYCIGLNNIIIFWNRFENMQKLKQILCGKIDLPFFDLDVVLKLFPNVEQIEYFNDLFASSFSPATIKGIIDYVMNTAASDTRLKYVIIHHKLSNISAYTESNTDWNIALIDEQVILSNKKLIIKFDPSRLIIRLPERHLGLSAGILLKKMRK